MSRSGEISSFSTSHCMWMKPNYLGQTHLSPSFLDGDFHCFQFGKTSDERHGADTGSPRVNEAHQSAVRQTDERAAICWVISNFTLALPKLWLNLSLAF